MSATFSLPSIFVESLADPFNGPFISLTLGSSVSEHEIWLPCQDRSQREVRQWGASCPASVTNDDWGVGQGRSHLVPCSPGINSWWAPDPGCLAFLHVGLQILHTRVLRLVDGGQPGAGLREGEEERRERGEEWEGGQRRGKRRKEKGKMEG